MAIEIERKFLVKSNSYRNEAHSKSYIKQGFLNTDKDRVVRVRIQDEKGFLTIKGSSNKEGTSRFEWEKEIALEEAKNLMLLVEHSVIEKWRFFVNNEKHLIEVDEFLGDNIGLIVAEIELNNENEAFNKPSWLGKEVTGNSSYYNSSLSLTPFKNWV